MLDSDTLLNASNLLHGVNGSNLQAADQGDDASAVSEDYGKKPKAKDLEEAGKGSSVSNVEKSPGSQMATTKAGSMKLDTKPVYRKTSTAKCNEPLCHNKGGKCHEHGPQRVTCKVQGCNNFAQHKRGGFCTSHGMECASSSTLKPKHVSFEDETKKDQGPTGTSPGKVSAPCAKSPPGLGPRRIDIVLSMKNEIKYSDTVYQFFNNEMEKTKDFSEESMKRVSEQVLQELNREVGKSGGLLLGMKNKKSGSGYVKVSQNEALQRITYTLKGILEKRKPSEPPRKKKKQNPRQEGDYDGDLEERNPGAMRRHLGIGRSTKKKSIMESMAPQKPPSKLSETLDENKIVLSLNTKLPNAVKYRDALNRGREKLWGKNRKKDGPTAAAELSLEVLNELKRLPGGTNLYRGSKRATDKDALQRIRADLSRGKLEYKGSVFYKNRKNSDSVREQEPTPENDTLLAGNKDTHLSSTRKKRGSSSDKSPPREYLGGHIVSLIRHKKWEGMTWKKKSLGGLQVDVAIRDNSGDSFAGVDEILDEAYVSGFYDSMIVCTEEGQGYLESRGILEDPYSIFSDELKHQRELRKQRHGHVESPGLESNDTSVGATGDETNEVNRETGDAKQPGMASGTTTRSTQSAARGSGFNQAGSILPPVQGTASRLFNQSASSGSPVVAGGNDFRSTGRTASGSDNTSRGPDQPARFAGVLNGIPRDQNAAQAPVKVEQEVIVLDNADGRSPGLCGDEIAFSEEIGRLASCYDKARANGDEDGKEFYCHLIDYLECKGRHDQFDLDDDKNVIDELEESFKSVSNKVQQATKKNQKGLLGHKLILTRIIKKMKNQLKLF